MKRKGACEMDKSGNRKSITIKINGQEKSFEEKKEDRSNPGNQMAAAAENSEEESFDWMLPDQDNGNMMNGKIKPAPLKKGKAAIYNFGGKTKMKGIKAPFIAILCAILLGTCLGFIILKTFTSNDRAAIPEKKPAISSAPASKPAAAEADTKKVSLPPLTTYLVQGGVFSSESSASDVQKTIKQKGMPSEIFKMNDRFYIFLGTAGSLEESKELASFYKQKKVPAFWKEVSFSASIKQEKQRKMLDEMSGLYSTLSHTTSGLLLSSAFSVDQKQLDQQLKAMNETTKDESAKPLSIMIQNLASSAEFLSRYQSTKNPEQLLLAQAKLLDFLQDYQGVAGK
jgi:stage II sporulation protein B